MLCEIVINSNLTLRLFTLNDAPELASLIQANSNHLSPWFIWASKIYSTQDAEKFIRKSQEAYENRQKMHLAIIYHNQIIGGTGWEYWQQQNDPKHQLSTASADLIYWLDESATGQGIIHRTLTALLNHAFHERNLHRITIRCEPDNTRSCRVAEKLGFKLEGITRHVAHWQDRWIDLRIYAMLADDWPPPQTAQDSSHK
ncbi:GNAT family N-acetyltransferase [Poriferisphaera sp. WC338]|uniref:GNAT family N-acetyltransferase n=1 Tax=Poriferisphaera sp. WC338 TaxID=3425129 RepID=UPI003D812B3A